VSIKRGEWGEQIGEKTTLQQLAEEAWRLELRAGDVLFVKMDLQNVDRKATESRYKGYGVGCSQSGHP
jgi:hypothetical protein